MYVAETTVGYLTSQLLSAKVSLEAGSVSCIEIDL